MSKCSNTVPIPVSAGERIAKDFGYDQVVIVARKVGVTEHVTTYGVDKAHCSVAARMGDFFKHKLMGWPEPKPAPASGGVVVIVERLSRIAYGVDEGCEPDGLVKEIKEVAALVAQLGNTP